MCVCECMESYETTFFSRPGAAVPSQAVCMYCNRQLELEGCFVLPVSEKAWHNWAQRGWVVF